MAVVPENILHYRIIKELGKGGMGEVYLAEDTRLDRKVALKILPQEFASDAGRMGRFVQEAKSASIKSPGHHNDLRDWRSGRLAVYCLGVHRR